MVDPLDPSNKNALVKSLMGVWNSDHLGVRTSIIVLVWCTLLQLSPKKVSKIQSLVAGIGFTAAGYQICQELVAKGIFDALLAGGTC